MNLHGTILSPLNVGDTSVASSVWGVEAGAGSDTRTCPGFMTGFLEPIPDGRIP